MAQTVGYCRECDAPMEAWDRDCPRCGKVPADALRRQRDAVRGGRFGVIGLLLLGCGRLRDWDTVWGGWTAMYFGLTFLFCAIGVAFFLTSCLRNLR